MTIDDLISTLLKNRGLVSAELVEGFFHPSRPADISISDVGLSPASVSSAISLINSQLITHNPIAVYGDYDVDGISATAILWETLYAFSKAVFPHIPHRKGEGYGLSQKGIDQCLEQGAKLIIVADSGIVANHEIDYCRKKGCDIIVIDHHEKGEKLPEASVILHTTQTTAAGISWFFVREFLRIHPSPKLRRGDGGEVLSSLLSLASISVICDLVPLIGINRSLAKYGLEALNLTTRPGFLALFAEAGITQGQIGPYEVGFMIGPRINAMGRLEHALDSLRLLCTTDKDRARDLAVKLGDTNKTRQDMTQKSAENAFTAFGDQYLPNLLVTADAGYDEGIIGLVAAKLVEKYFRPAIAISIGPEVSKASARSVKGFHITDFLRRFEDILVSVGGHEMAAGFSVPTPKLKELQERLSQAAVAIPKDLLIKSKRIDAEIPLGLLGLDLYTRLQDFAPYGLGNPRPVFLSANVPIYYPQRIGTAKKHLRFSAESFKAIFFNAPPEIETGLSKADITYNLDLNTYNGFTNLQLVIKELKSITT